MPHIKTYSQYEEIKNLVVYVILSPYSNIFFVGKCLKRALKDNYKNHNLGRNKQTQDLFESAKSMGLQPRMYQLEELNTTEVVAFRHIVAWVRYFEELGYYATNYEKIREYAQDMMPETQEIYDNIKDIEFAEIVCDANDLFPDYGERKKKIEAAKELKSDQDSIILSFRVTKKEAEEIKKIADGKGLSISEYARETLLDGTSVNVSFNGLGEISKRISASTEIARLILYTIHKTQTYTPSDLSLVQDMVDTIMESQDKILDEMQKTMKQARREIRAARRR